MAVNAAGLILINGIIGKTFLNSLAGESHRDLWPTLAEMRPMGMAKRVSVGDLPIREDHEFSTQDLRIGLRFKRYGYRHGAIGVVPVLHYLRDDCLRCILVG